MLDARIPDGPLSEKWNRYKANSGLVSPGMRSKFEVLVVGTGLAGASAAASLAEMGFKVKAFCFQDSARRAHSVAAQGGVNAAKNYQNDGDNVFRMFKDTLKGGDFRAREANVYRLAECSMALIDQAVAQGVPFAREYSGYLNNRSFGGVQVSRTFYARGQTGQQLLLGSYQALMRQVGRGQVQLYTRHEMLDLVTENGQAKGIIVRNLETGALERHAGHAVVIASGGFGKIYYLSTLAMGCNATAIWRCHKRGAHVAAPSWTQFHPTSLPQSGSHQSKLTLMSESLRNDGRIWVPTKPDDARPGNDIPEAERDYYLERRYPAFGNLTPRDIASRAARERIQAGHGVGPLRNAVFLDFRKAIEEQGQENIQRKYGNLFAMYEKITGINAYKQPMLISPSAHFSMGGLWVDYELMSNLPGLFVLGEANFSDHGANRLGANSLLQACVDGYFIAPYTLMNFLSTQMRQPLPDTRSAAFETAEQAVAQQVAQLLDVQGSTTADEFHRELGRILYDRCGVSRQRAGLVSAIDDIQALRQQFHKELLVPGKAQSINSELEKAGRVADYLELGELMCRDALSREESCGAHFREEYQTAQGEAKRNDAEYGFVPVWEWTGNPSAPALHPEWLQFSEITPTERSYQ